MRQTHSRLLVLPSVILLVQLFPPDVTGYFAIAHLNKNMYVREGDLNIGAIVSVTYRDMFGHLCGKNVPDFFRIDMVESIVHYISQANERYLPNLDLGFVIADACNKESTAAAQALRFLPTSHFEEGSLPDDSFFRGRAIKPYRVVGVIGTDADFTARPAALVLSTSDVPLVSFRATSDSLSDQVLYPNFFRTVAPDAIHLKAMAHYLKEKRWTYFSVVYQNEETLQSLFQQIRLVMSESEICIDLFVRVSSVSNFPIVLGQLTQPRPKPSKIVLVLTSHYISLVISMNVLKMNLDGKLFWFGLDTWLTMMLEGKAPIGSVGIGYTAMDNDTMSITPILAGLTMDTPNPWFKSALMFMNCSTIECYRDALTTKYTENHSLRSLIYKAVYVLVWSLSAFLADHCPHTNTEMIISCFHQKSVHFTRFIRTAYSTSPWVRENLFTEDESHGRLSVFQLVKQDNQRLLHLADFDVKERTFSHLSEVDDKPFLFEPIELRTHESCRPTCDLREFRYFISTCCWTCKKCQEGEIVSEDGLFCDHCPPLFWPEQTVTNESLCSEIAPDFHTYVEPLSVFLISATVVGALFVLFVFFWYLLNRANNLVKASSAELNYIHLLTFLGGYLSVPIFMSEPTHLHCNLGLFLFTSSFNISYMIMVTKAIRVYRIFTMSLKRMRMSYISCKFHIMVCLGFLLEEVIRFLITAHFFPIQSALIQPHFNVEYVEKTCLIPPFHMVAFIVMGFLLLLICLFFAFKTQTLPSRFRESLYVTNCVMTSLIVWSCFLPAYFTSFYHNTRVLYIVFAVIIQNSMTLALIFVSRLLVVEYVKGDGILFGIISLLCY